MWPLAQPPKYAAKYVDLGRQICRNMFFARGPPKYVLRYVDILPGPRGTHPHLVAFTFDGANLTEDR
eukprot:scaffold184669_cov26-Tisochrysis_lutea.AAC.1